MTLADLQLFIKGDPVMGWFFIACALIFGLAVLALPVALLWGVCKSGKRTAFVAAGYLIIQGFVIYSKFPGDRNGQLLGLGFAVAGVVLFMIAMFFMNKPELTHQQLQEELDKETRSALHSTSGKVISIFWAVSCFAAAYVVNHDKWEEETATVLLGLYALGFAGVFAFLFPAKMASFLEALGRFFPQRHRW